MQKSGGQTKITKRILDLDQLYEATLKIFGDVFESLIGAIFIDSESITVTWSVLHRLMEPYIPIYSDLNNLQEHSRTKLLELWNSKSYMKNRKCTHITETLEGSKAREYLAYVKKNQIPHITP